MTDRLRAEETAAAVQPFTPCLHVVLDRPRIAQNIGAVVRLCANIGAALHVCGPFQEAWRTTGFGGAQKRAGLDYWGHTPLFTHATINEALAVLEIPAVVVEVDGDQVYDDVEYALGDVIVFGPEDGSVADTLPSRARVCLPTRTAVRSLNLAQCAAVVSFEALRQIRKAGALDGASARRGPR